MHLISINIGQERQLQRSDRVERAGIFKLPVDGPVKVTKLGLERDVIVSKKHHGGPDQAVYVYGATDYEWWAKVSIARCIVRSVKKIISFSIPFGRTNQGELP